MFLSDRNIFLKETEVRPNRYAVYVMVSFLFGSTFCWLLNEIGLFRCGDTEMRIGSALSIIIVCIPLLMLKFGKNMASNPAVKYVVIICASLLTLNVTTLLTFHTTIMLLFPIFVGMLYRSLTLGKIAVVSSTFCTLVSPVLGYLLGTWDIELFKELILIGTNGTAVVEGAFNGISIISIIKILFYISLPRLIMVGSCALLMFYVIRLGVDHVNNQIILDNFSHRDELTGLYNRSYLTDVLEMNKNVGTCGVFFFDVNDLKQVNDSYGHEAGDLLLRKCAESLLKLCNDEKSGAFRMGGDEFMLLSFGIDDNRANGLIKSVDNLLAEVNKTSELMQSNIVCSMAVGYSIGDIADFEKLLRFADTQMYANKSEMKNAQ